MKLNINGFISEGERANSPRREQYGQRVQQIINIFNAVHEGIGFQQYKDDICEPYMDCADLTQSINYAEIRDWAGIPNTGFEDEDERIDGVIELVCKAFARGIYGRK